MHLLSGFSGSCGNVIYEHLYIYIYLYYIHECQHVIYIYLACMVTWCICQITANIPPAAEEGYVDMTGGLYGSILVMFKATSINTIDVLCMIICNLIK